MVSEDSTSCRSPSQSTVKKRKPTYLEEEQALKDEILELQAQVAVLKTKGVSTGAAIAADPSQQQSTAKWKVLSNTIKSQQLGRTQYLHPLHSRIRLGKNWGERRATLMAMRESKLKGAYDYVMARSRFATDSHDSNEQYETDEGDICFVGNTVVKFPGVQSLEQVFEALCFYLTNMEISISETLGHITVREDYDMVEGSAYNARIVSSDSNGISTESNTIVLMQLIREDDLRFGGEPCVVVASDCVDEDELYPYGHQSTFARTFQAQLS
ncbi:hypothetical protein PInf_010495 [Phytophthora infestans]|nr:hypothetical protein PInf_010495 [Phytophthora infestans]